MDNLNKLEREGLIARSARMTPRGQSSNIYRLSLGVAFTDTQVSPLTTPPLSSRATPPVALSDTESVIEPVNYSSSSAREELLSRVPHRPTWEALMNGALQGLDTPLLSPEQLDRAIVDFVGNGAAGSPNVSHFRAYLRRAAKPEPVPEQRSPAGTTSNGAGRAALILAKIREMVEESHSPAHAAVKFIRKGSVVALGPDVEAAYEAIGGAERIIGTTGKDHSFLARDFAAALEAAQAGR